MAIASTCSSLPCTPSHSKARTHQEMNSQTWASTSITQRIPCITDRPVFRTEQVGGSTTISISNKFPSVAAAASLGPHFKTITLKTEHLWSFELPVQKIHSFHITYKTSHAFLSRPWRSSVYNPMYFARLASGYPLMLCLVNPYIPPGPSHSGPDTCRLPREVPNLIKLLLPHLQGGHTISLTGLLWG